MKTTKALGLLLACILFSGCQTTKSPSFSPWSWNRPGNNKRQPAVGKPTRIVAIWSHDIINTPGQLATQGFGGRLYFYDDNNNTIPVEGQLTIHGYDDSQRSEAQGHFPDKKFVFTPEQLKQHYGKSELGASYSVWIPWQAIGGIQRQVSLVPTFKTTTGNQLVGYQTRNLLPGRKPIETDDSERQVAQATGARISRTAPSTRRPTISPTAYQQRQMARSPGQPQTPSFTTTTIDVPRSMTQQMQNPAIYPTGLTMPPNQNLPRTTMPPLPPTAPANRSTIPNPGQLPAAGPANTSFQRVPHGRSQPGNRNFNPWTPAGTPLRMHPNHRASRPPVTSSESTSQPTHYELYRHQAPATSAP